MACLCKGGITIKSHEGGLWGKEGRGRVRCGLVISCSQQSVRGKVRPCLRSISRTMKLGISRNNQIVKRTKEERKVIDNALHIYWCSGGGIHSAADRGADKGPAWELWQAGITLCLPINGELKNPLWPCYGQMGSVWVLWKHRDSSLETRPSLSQKLYPLKQYKELGPEGLAHMREEGCF